MRRFQRTVRTAVHSFTWFIYRMTNPTIRQLFMAPSRVFGMQAAVLSLLAGDLFRGTPIHWRLRAFKALYYLLNLFHPLRSFAGWRNRKRLLRERLTGPLQS
jgi:hypothetical protein